MRRRLKNHLGAGRETLAFKLVNTDRRQQRCSTVISSSAAKSITHGFVVSISNIEKEIDPPAADCYN
jgi:hypothetical protein